MASTNSGFLESLFAQIESQVQFGDTKATLLVAGDTILLAISWELIKMVGGCASGALTPSCVQPSGSLLLAGTAASLLTLSLVLALRAARPALVHDRPSSELFLVSNIARADRDAFAKSYVAASSDDLVQAALSSIHGKAVYATRKFRLLKRAIDATLLSLGFMVATLVLALGARIFSA